MANTYTSLHYHILFSTKNRERWITPEIEQRVWTYLGGIARQKDMTALKVGGVEDHVHLVLGLPSTLAPSKAAQLLKGGSSNWIHDTFPALSAFRWQDGYGAFTVSKSNLPEVIQYVESQREHHRKRTFQEFPGYLLMIATRSRSQSFPVGNSIRTAIKAIAIATPV